MEKLFINRTNYFTKQFLELAASLPHEGERAAEEADRSIFVDNVANEEVLVPPYLLSPGSWWWGNDR